MNTRRTLAGFMLAVGLVGLGAHAAGAQGQSPQSGRVPTTNRSPVTLSAEKINYAAAGTTSTLMAQGNVKISRTDGTAVNMTATSDGFVIPLGSSQGKTQVAKFPMDMATLRVSVTPTGTVFTDGKGDSLTVNTSATAP